MTAARATRFRLRTVLRQFTASTWQSVTGAWLQTRHPGVSVGLQPSFARRSRSPRLTVRATVRRVPSMEGVVSIAQGRLRGVWRGDLWSFSGIPYARAPVGQLRWRPPLPPEAWDEVRDASTFGPIAPQSPSLPGITSPSDPEVSEPHSEDCLSLNVWTPDLPETPTHGPGHGRPVMVFIHGGGFTSGSGSVFLYRGGNLVRNGNAVVVTINYRLGALGFLGHRELADPDGLVGNWGIHDQLAALGVGARQHRSLRRRCRQRHRLRRVGRWVQRCHAARDTGRGGPVPPSRGAERGRARALRGGVGALGGAPRRSPGDRLVRQVLTGADPGRRARRGHGGDRTPPS